jgi:hypothetical protein
MPIETVVKEYFRVRRRFPHWKPWCCWEFAMNGYSRHIL